MKNLIITLLFPIYLFADFSWSPDYLEIRDNFEVLVDSKNIDVELETTDAGKLYFINLKIDGKTKKFPLRTNFINIVSPESYKEIELMRTQNLNKPVLINFLRRGPDSKPLYYISDLNYFNETKSDNAGLKERSKYHLRKLGYDVFVASELTEDWRFISIFPALILISIILLRRKIKTN